MAKYITIAVAVVCIICGWTVSRWKDAAEIESLRSRANMLARDAADWKNRAIRAEEAAADLGKKVMAQNLAIQTAASDLAKVRGELDSIKGRLSAERKQWKEREAQLMQPLPDTCDEAVREVIRRIQEGHK